MKLDPVYLIYAAMAVSIVISQINKRAASPILALANRWMRWIIFANGLALVCVQLDWTDYPFWVLAVVFALLWFLGETLYNWVAIKALSASPLPLFPKFAVNDSGEEWPMQKQFLAVRDWLRAKGFSQVQALRAELIENVYLRVSIYHDVAAKVRLQITFLPQTNGAISMCVSFSTQTTDDRRFVTDNMYLPFAGFYPENWYVERNPWKRSLESLLKRHEQRLAKNEVTAEPWTSEPLHDLNAQQRDLETLNTQLGFLTPHAEREELGKVSNAGRYRVWKEIWLLNYLGKSARYE